MLCRENQRPVLIEAALSQAQKKTHRQVCKTLGAWVQCLTVRSMRRLPAL